MSKKIIALSFSLLLVVALLISPVFASFSSGNTKSNSKDISLSMSHFGNKSFNLHNKGNGFNRDLQIENSTEKKFNLKNLKTKDVIVLEENFINNERKDILKKLVKGGKFVSVYGENLHPNDLVDDIANWDIDLKLNPKDKVFAWGYQWLEDEKKFKLYGISSPITSYDKERIQKKLSKKIVTHAKKVKNQESNLLSSLFGASTVEASDYLIAGTVNQTFEYPPYGDFDMDMRVEQANSGSDDYWATEFGSTSIPGEMLKTDGYSGYEDYETYHMIVTGQTEPSPDGGSQYMTDHSPSNNTNEYTTTTVGFDSDGSASFGYSWTNGQTVITNHTYEPDLYGKWWTEYDTNTNDSIHTHKVRPATEVRQTDGNRYSVTHNFEVAWNDLDWGIHNVDAEDGSYVGLTIYPEH